jgi:hypothetical protein
MVGGAGFVVCCPQAQTGSCLEAWGISQGPSLQDTRASLRPGATIDGRTSHRRKKTKNKRIWKKQSSSEALGTWQTQLCTSPTDSEESKIGTLPRPNVSEFRGSWRGEALGWSFDVECWVQCCDFSFLRIHQSIITSASTCYPFPHPPLRSTSIPPRSNGCSIEGILFCAPRLQLQQCSPPQRSLQWPPRILHRQISCTFNCICRIHHRLFWC